MWAGLMRRGSGPGSSAGKKSSTHVAGNVTKPELPWRRPLCEVGLEQAAWGSEGAQKTAAGTQGSKGVARARGARSRHRRTRSQGEEGAGSGRSKLLHIVGGLPNPKSKQPFNGCLLCARPWARPLR